MLIESVTISRRDFDAAIFDLDGVLTDTAGIHAVAWKSVFDTFLQRWAQERGLPFQPFDIETDYLNYVDGRPRYDGIRNFLAARGITLPEGSEDLTLARWASKTKQFALAIMNRRPGVRRG